MEDGKVKVWKLALAGCGVVGKGVLDLLTEKCGLLEKKYGFRTRVCLVTTAHHGTALDINGLCLDDLLKKANKGEVLGDTAGSFDELLERSGADILVEVTPTNLNDGEPGLGHIRSALNRGMHVVTSNKGPIALAFNELMALAEKKGVKLLHEGVVQGGTPLFAMIQKGLAGAEISEVKGILNASTNFILTEMETGKTYAQACDKARGQGLIEADPTLDVDGWDAAVKLVILARVLYGADMKVADVDREGITKLTPEILKEADSRGYRVKLLAQVSNVNGVVKASVRPTELPLSNPLSQVVGADNSVTLITDTLGPVTLRGSGGGRRETAQGILANLISIARC